MLAAGLGSSFYSLLPRPALRLSFGGLVRLGMLAMRGVIVLAFSDFDCGCTLSPARVRLEVLSPFS